MTESSLGFHEEPRNGDGIIRCRTTGQIRCWDAPRSDKAIERFSVETGKASFPGVYLLLAGKKVYVGEAGSLYDRVRTHMKMPDKKIKDWSRMVLINDGRLAAYLVKCGYYGVCSESYCKRHLCQVEVTVPEW